MKVQLDHLMTYTNAPSLEEVLEGYRRAGFSVGDSTRRHEPGLRNGFVSIGPEYLEICWVEDEETFRRGDPHGHELIEDPRVCGIGFTCGDLRALREAWSDQGIRLPEPWAASERGSDEGPKWTFQELPVRLLPGAGCFLLSYHRPRPPFRVGPNTIFGLEGVTLVTPVPERRALRWQAVLAPESEVEEEAGGGFRLDLDPHFVRWLSAEVFVQRFGRHFRPAIHPMGDTAAVHLLAEDIGEALRWLESAGRRTELRADGGLLCEPAPRDGVLFVIRQASFEAWLRGRRARGEVLRIQG
jgi:hypothetical protein